MKNLLKNSVTILFVLFTIERDDRRVYGYIK